MNMRFLLRGKELERSSVVPDKFMAMNMGEGDVSKLGGIPMYRTGIWY